MIKNLASLFIIIALCGACATSPKHTADPSDPWQGFNRKVYSFNNALDQAFLLPITTGYRAVAPEVVEDGVGNFFSNLGDIGVAFNNTLQFKFLDAASDVGRFLVNSTIGLLGFLDVASKMGLEKHNEDFGQTLGYWGMGSGPYLMLPLLGPSNLRDGPSKVVDHFTYPPTWIDMKTGERVALFGMNLVNTRSGLIDLEEKTGDLGRDRYVFIRDAYLDNRKFLINDGAIEADNDLYDELEEE